MPIIYQHRYIPQDCIANPAVLYVFGDNLLHQGKAGQAIIRGQPNAVGLYTKLNPWQFLRDEDLKNIIDKSTNRRHRLERHHKQGGIIIWPLDNIGTGLAKLCESAPIIADYWNAFLNHLDMNYHMRSRRI